MLNPLQQSFGEREPHRVHAVFRTELFIDVLQYHLHCVDGNASRRGDFRAGNFSAVLPYEMELQRQEAKEFQDDLMNRDQRMFFANVTLIHTADTLAELDNDTDGILTTGRKHTCQLATLKWQQMDGLLTALRRAQPDTLGEHLDVPLHFVDFFLQQCVFGDNNIMFFAPALTLVFM